MKVLKVFVKGVGRRGLLDRTNWKNDMHNHSGDRR